MRHTVHVYGLRAGECDGQGLTQFGIAQIGHTLNRLFQGKRLDSVLHTHEIGAAQTADMVARMEGMAGVQVARLHEMFDALVCDETTCPCIRIREAHARDHSSATVAEWLTQSYHAETRRHRVRRLIENEAIATDRTSEILMIYQDRHPLLELAVPKEDEATFPALEEGDMVIYTLTIEAGRVISWGADHRVCLHFEPLPARKLCLDQGGARCDNATS